MKRLHATITAVALILAAAVPAFAQTQFPSPDLRNAAPLEVMGCLNGSNQAVPCSASFPLAVNASVSASITGFPTTQSTGTPISVTTSGVAGTLPTGAVVVATNVGTTNGAYCKLGASATTSDQFIAPNGGWFAFTVGASTQLTCITSTSTTTVNMVGGSGLPTGTGGGGGGAAGSTAITTWAGGTLGAMANYGTSPGAVLVPGVNASVTASALPTGAATSANQATEISSLASILSAVQGAIPTQAPTVSIGGVGIIDSAGTNVATVKAASTAPATTDKSVVVALNPNAGLPARINEYPFGAVPYSATATGTTGATTATLAAAASVTTYLCGFSIRANATAAATGNATVTGTLSGTMNFTQWTAPNASGLGVTEMIFTPCYPASAANTAIAVVSAAPGTGGVVSVTAWGYKVAP